MKNEKVLWILVLMVFFTSCEKDIYIGIIESLPTSFGKFYISSNPKGYKIFVDDKNWDTTTPDTVKWITNGKHKLSLKHELFSDSSLVFTLNDNFIQSFSIDMISNPRFWGKIICSTIPSGANIFINDQLTNYSTPANISHLYPGVFKIKLVKVGCRDDSLNIKVKGGSYTEVNRILDDTTRGVDYRTVNSQIPSDQLEKVVIDKNNNKWISSINHTLIKFDGINWTSFENSGIFITKILTDILIDSKNRLWVGTPNGLYRYNGIIWQKFADELPSETITALEEDKFGNIWIGTIYGLAKYDNVKFTIYNKSSGMPENWVNCLTSDSNGDIWIGSNYFAVVKYSNGIFTRYDNYINMKLELGISKYIAAMDFDKKGNLWVFHKADSSMGTRDALTKFDGAEWREIKLPLPISLEIVSINSDNQDNVWFSGKEGLVKFNETQPIKLFNNYEYGFYVTHTTSTAMDSNGDLWITTMGGGLIKLKKANFN